MLFLITIGTRLSVLPSNEFPSPPVSILVFRGAARLDVVLVGIGREAAEFCISEGAGF